MTTPSPGGIWLLIMLGGEISIRVCCELACAFVSVSWRCLAHTCGCAFVRLCERNVGHYLIFR